MSASKSTKTNNEEYCFAIMPISDVDTHPKGHFHHVYQDIISPACEKSGFRACRADDVKATNLIQLDILKKLIEAPHISLMPKTCLPANSGGTNAVFGNGVFTNTPCATKRICNVAQTISISIPSNMDCAAMSAIGRFRRFTVMYGMDGCR